MSDVKIYTVMSDELSPPIHDDSFCTDMVRYSDYAALEAKRDALAAENAAQREYRPQLSGAAMMEALDAFYEYHEDVPEQGMMAAFEILRCKRPETIATDAFLREQMAKGVEMFAEMTEKVSAEEDFYDNGESAATLKYVAKQATLFASQLRNGEAV